MPICEHSTPTYNLLHVPYRYRIFDTAYPHFLTCTTVGWLAVFTRIDAVEIVLDSWRFLQQNRGLDLFGYVILENHLHWIASAPELANAVKSFKMYTARGIVELLERCGAETLLRSSGPQAAAQDRERLPGLAGRQPPAADRQPDMMLQKLEYMHNNP